MCGIAWRAQELVMAVTRDSPTAERRAARALARRWLGTLPAGLALEQEDGIGIVSNPCGYDVEAVKRSFRARFWQRQPSRPGLELERDF